MTTVLENAIQETANAFIVNGIEIPRLQRGKLNIYKPELIKAIGTEQFLDLVATKKTIEIPDFGFSQAEWNEMEKLLTND